MLTPGDIDAIAGRLAEVVTERVTERLEQAFATRLWIGLVDATELAERLGVRESWVYAHAGDLEAIRLGDGPKGRLRFDLQRVARAVGLTAGETPRGPGRPRQHGLPPNVRLIQGRTHRQ
jgi:hypothetical protein